MSNSQQRNIQINAPVLARVEGEGALEMHIADGRIQQLKLRIFEPPRLFEKFLEGRGPQEVIDMVARICGICPVAYQMSAVHALEQVFQVKIPPWVRRMRRLLYCGEWLESHSLHIHLLAAPDFFGYKDAISMSAEHPEVVKRGLHLQSIGNDILRLLGGRSVHPVGVRVGGFHRAPSPEAIEALRLKIFAALPQAKALVQWAAQIPVPEHEQNFLNFALHHADEYAFNEGVLCNSKGQLFAVSDYEQHFREYHQENSTALYSSFQNLDYLVGPLARLNVNREQLPDAVLENLARTGIGFPSKNMFHSLLARAVEIHFALLEALNMTEDYQLPAQPYVDFEPQAGTGFGCTEAPRGMLWHRWDINAEGLVEKVRIVPPTSQNQLRIEEDLRLSLQHFGVDRSAEDIQQHSEMLIRNYDPCISCATHFLKLDIQRG